MKSMRNILPAVIVLAVLIAAALGIGLLSRMGQGQPSMQAAPVADDGPNAELSNDELVSMAITNMVALKSYGFEVVGVEPAGAITPTYRVTLTGYEQPPGKAVMVSARGKTAGANNYSLIGIFADEAQQLPHEMILSEDGTFISGDGGKTWQPFSSSGGYFVPPVVLLCTWGSRDRGFPPCADMVGYWNFKDAEPRTEAIDGVPTRHLVADALTDAKDQSRNIDTPMISRGGTEGAAIHVWISTDATPLVQRMRIDITSQETMGAGVNAPLTGVAFSPDGKLLAGTCLGTGSDPSSQGDAIVVWDLTKPDSPPVKPGGLYGEDVRKVAFSPDGKVLVVAGFRGVHMWDTDNLDANPTALTIPGKVSPASIAFSPDGKMLGAAGSADGIYIWERPYKGAPELALPDPASALAFSPDGHTLAASGKDGIKLYNLDNLKAAPTMLGQAQYRAGSLALSPNSRLLAANGYPGGGDASQGQLQVWDLRQPQQPIASFAGDGEHAVTFSPDGKLLAVEGGRIWDVAQLLSAGSKASPYTPKDVCGNAIAFSPDSRKLAAGCQQPEVQIWDVSNFPNMGDPTILRRDPTSANKLTYSLTWSWNRFNEVFDEIKAPSGAVPSPSAVGPLPEASPTPVASAPMPAGTTQAAAPGMPRTGREAGGGGDGNLLASALVLLAALGLALAGRLLRRMALKE